MTVPKYFENTATTATSWGCQFPPLVQESPLKTVEMVFSDEVKTISALCLSQHEDREQAMECIHECVKAVSKNLELLDFSLPAEARRTLEHNWTLFDTALQQEISLDIWEPERIRSEFRCACLTSIKKTWCTDAAQQFYRILLLSNREEKISKAQSWSETFAAGAFYLGELARKSFVNPEHFYGKVLAHTTQDEFRNCYMNVMEQRAKLVVKFAERNPEVFANKMVIIEKKQKNCDSLSAEEKEIVACTDYGVSHCTQHWPDLENKTQLLNACISSKYPQGNTPQPSFAELLTKFEAAESENKKKVYPSNQVRTIADDLPLLFSSVREHEL